MWIERDWTSVRPNDFVMAKDGTTWKVIDRLIMGQVVLLGSEGQQTAIEKPSGPVWWWDPDPNAENVQAFIATLGATVVYDQH